MFAARTDSHRIHVYGYDAGTIQYVQTYRAPSAILDVCWYMYPASSDDGVAHWCFALSCRDVPVRLVDARTGESKSTYAIVNHVEEQVAPQVLAFSSDCAR